MPKAINIQAELASLTHLRNRQKDMPEDVVGDAFARLAEYDEGAVFTGSFDGESPWERHTKGDELVHVLAGQTQLTILGEEGEDVLELQAGMLTVVPKSCWHRFKSPEGVTLLTVTPQPTDHSSAEDPR
ncbi:cupin domain-containing protein [Sneathiella marina]|uniref:Cupin domain-containing protein n=1 Tax=Sneathiella marina TaxID=2950108 RepID=A0ABY4W5D7_9PROT|nr:cupin domain-containing protein [Sneathiella marina]USG62405.1 cupin domain-containing protein [Sneathiella marina]